ncbi:MAG TPA: hypothetical protein VGG34_16025 [Opitutaceae bacterium]
MTPQIDAAYTWVDGTDPSFLEEARRHSQAPQDLNPERFRDPYDLLRYSLRSLEANAPWLGRVFLLTRRAQAPAWLKRDHPRLRLVHHDEVAPERGMLPTFNSNVIESLLHRLPGVSEHFVYMNDDYFLCSRVPREAFYAPDGRIRVFGTLVGEHIRGRVYERQLLSFGLVEHGPVLIDRAEWQRMQEDAADEMAKLHLHRFRQGDDLRPDRLYRWHMLSRRRESARAEPFWRYLRNAAFHKVTPGVAGQRRALGAIARRPPWFLCLNDDLGPGADPEVVEAVRAFLRELFPRPSSFEA